MITFIFISGIWINIQHIEALHPIKNGCKIEYGIAWGDDASRSEQVKTQSSCEDFIKRISGQMVRHDQ